MADSLKKRTITGVGWSAADAFLGQGVTFLVGLVLARILSPSEYGLIGIVTIFTTVLSGIVDSGFSNALIRKTDTTEEDYSTMFITNLVISLLLYLFLFSSAPIISSFFGRPELTDITRVTGLILIIQSLSLVQNTILTKRIDFKTKTKASVISASVSGVVGITMAVSGYGVWALVGQLIAKQVLYSVLLWMFNKWWPKGGFNIKSFRYMWGFGWKMMLSGLLNNIWNQLYQVTVGKFYSPATLGQYSRANEYANIFSQNFTTIVQRVTYPALSEVQDEKERMVAAYRKVIKITMFVTAVCMFSMGAVAEPLIYCLIGEKWHQAATFLPFICVSMSLYPLHAINLNMLQIQGRSDLFLILEIIKKVIAVGPICLGIFVNIYWMLIGSIVSGIISFFLNAYYSGRELDYSSLRQLKDVAPSFLVSMSVAISVYFVKYLPISNYIVLLVQIAVGSVVFFTICEVTRIEEYIELKGICISYLNKILNKK